jgi:hypothetical protein
MLDRPHGTCNVHRCRVVRCPPSSDQTIADEKNTEKYRSGSFQPPGPAKEATAFNQVMAEPKRIISALG